MTRDRHIESAYFGLYANWNPTSALKLCETAVVKLKDSVKKFPELDAQNVASTVPSPRMCPGGRWQRLKLAKNDAKLLKYLSRLQNAKQGLQLLHLSIRSNIGLKSHLLIEKSSANLQQSMERLSIQGIKAQEACDTTLRSVQHLSAVSNDTQAELLAMKSDLSQQLGSLHMPGVLSSMMKAAVAEALAEHTTRMSSEAQVRPEPRVVEELDSDQEDELDPTKQEQNHRFSVNSRSHNLDDPSSQPSHDESRSHQSQIRRTGKRQRSSESSYNTWFGRIIITTTITERDEVYLPEPDQIFKLTARRTMITLLPNILFSNWGAKFQMGTSRPADNHPLWDNRLRVFRTHLPGSPIYRVLERGDFLEFRNMLERREVTPFDDIQVYPRGSEYMTWFEKVMQILEYDMPTSQSLQGQLDIAKLLADRGTDCGLGSSMFYLQIWVENVAGVHKKVALELYYTILSHSETNPFESDIRFIESYAIRSFLSEDDWDLYDARDQHERVPGRGSWNALVRDNMPSREWEFQQEDA
ncbi:MAG: hypothetical protein Q9160_008282 [Pyrenula sp. 1 TL-2023]